MPKSSFQQSVDDIILALGGYWPPVFSCLRLFEELGEIAEALKAGCQAELSEECADLLFISSSLANQYDIECPSVPKPLLITPEYEDLVITAGHIARVVNQLEGPKKLKQGEKPKALNDLLLKLQQQLRMFAKWHQVDLEQSFDDKIQKLLAKSKSK